MMKFPFVNIPQQFSHILQSNMQGSDSDYENIKDSIYADQGLRVITKMAFEDLGKKLEVGSVIKSIGWEAFRDRIAGAYLKYAEDGTYSGKEVAEEPLKNVKNFENAISHSSVSGYDRGFLLGLYLELSRLGKNTSGKPLEIIIDEDVLNCLELSKSRIIQIDWVILLLFHFKEFLGIETVMKNVRNGSGFNALYGEINQEQEEIMLGNLLRYGGSIDDVDALSMQRI